jgi:hypothetical protein
MPPGVENGRASRLTRDFRGPPKSALRIRRSRYFRQNLYAVFIIGRRVAVSNLYAQATIFHSEIGRVPRPQSAGKTTSGRRLAMYDTLMLAIGCGFFVAAVLYALACEKM